MPIIPVGGFAGFAQQTPAVQSLYRGGRRASGSGRRRRKKKAAAAPRRRRRAAAKSRGRGKLKRLVKGSAAAKRYMAKIRRMRK